MNPAYSLNNAITSFIDDCNHSIEQLNSAERTEWLDTMTSNKSWIGFCVAMSSHSQNNRVAQAIDNLQSKALHINHIIDSSQLRGRVIPLNTSFSGSRIRQAENAEHSFLPNLVAGSLYSSWASLDTAGELSRTKEIIIRVRHQANEILRMTFCNPFPQPPCPPPQYSF